MVRGEFRGDKGSRSDSLSAHGDLRTVRTGFCALCLLACPNVSTHCAKFWCLPTQGYAVLYWWWKPLKLLDPNVCLVRIFIKDASDVSSALDLIQSVRIS